MSFIELNGIGDTKEPELAPEDKYDLLITFAEFYTNEKGRGVIRMSIEMQGHPEYQSIGHWLALPSRDLDVDGDDDSKYEKAMLRTRRFLEMFSVPYENGFDVEDLQGATATGVKVIQEEGDDEIVRNRIVVPRLSS